jgi:hypothetical protein
MKESSVAIYLPTLEQNSGRLPERDFFFAILSTVKPDYVKTIVESAH